MNFFRVPFWLFFAFRIMFSAGRDGFIAFSAVLSFLGMVIGVSSLVIVTSVMNGFRHEFVSRMIGMEGHISLKHSQMSIDDFYYQADLLMNHDCILEVRPKIDAKVVLSKDLAAVGAILKGVFQDDFNQDGFLANITNVKPKDCPGFDYGESIIIGKRLATELKVIPGDSIRMLLPGGAVTIFGAVPAFKDVMLCGVFNSGSYEIDVSTAYSGITGIASMLNRGSLLIDETDIFVENPDNVEKVEKIISEMLPDIKITTWKKRNAIFMNALNTERNVMRVILISIVMVAAFSIVSCLSMAVREKRFCIAVLRASGVSKQEIVKSFLFCGLFLGFCGSIFGALLGAFFTSNIENIKNFIENSFGLDVFNPAVYFLDNLPSKLDFIEVRNSVIFALISSAFASFIPAMKAAREEPADLILTSS